MTTQDAPITPSAWSHLRVRVAEVRLTVALSAWTPLVVVGLAIIAVLTAAGGALLFTRLGELAQAGQSRAGASAPDPASQLPALEFTLAPDALRSISMDEARAFNAGLPFSTLPILSARPFIMPPERLTDYARALDCLTAAVYYESASETVAGQAAVAQVVINRMRHPAFPKTVCGVVFQGQERTTGCQFSFTCDGALGRVPSAAGWARARAVASAALNGAVAPQVGMATHYHTDWVAPYWAERLVKMTQIDTHIFYRWTGAWGLPAAFTGAHAGAEPVITKLAAVATYVEELPLPVTETAELDLALGEPINLAAPLRVEPQASGESADAAPAEAVVEAVAAPPPPPAVLANPLAPPSTSAPQRRTRIAVPR
jgi:hypothetical protein